MSAAEARRMTRNEAQELIEAVIKCRQTAATAIVAAGRGIDGWADDVGRDEQAFRIVVNMIWELTERDAQ